MELQNIQQSFAGIYRVNEFLNESQEIIKNKKLTAEGIIKNKENLILEFENLNFKYEGSPYILKNVCMVIEHKENVTFIGRTGAGKSTLFKLILGLLEPTSGLISIGGIDVTTIPNNEKRKIFGYVEQSFHFINGTIAEQISVRDANISREDIEKAMKFAGLHDYVLGFENGYDTVASEYLFSQGQRQLLSIARAIVTNPPIMLLDEITANLDSETEEKIIAVLQEASADRTLLSISHRLSSMIRCDRIITLENSVLRY